MKRKNIKFKIVDKVKDWLSSIKDEKLRSDVKSNLIVTGGAIVSMLLDEKVNDYDIYIKNKDVLKRLLKYYLDKYDCGNMVLLDGKYKNDYLRGCDAGKYESDDSVDNLIQSFQDDEDGENDYRNGFLIAVSNLENDQLKLFSTEGIFKNDILKIRKKYPDDEEFKHVYEPYVYTANAITFTNDIQLIIRFFGEPKEIHENYDFVHVTNYFTFYDGLVLNKKALESILTKTLYYRGSKYPLTSIIRTRKFLNRGFTISAAEYLKMAWQISKLNLSDPAVLEEQLMGVDVAYFKAIIKEINKALSKNENFKLTSEWLFSLLDRVFYDSDDDDIE